MVDFTLGEKDRATIEELRKQAKVQQKYARYYDEHEEELPPEEFPEAPQFDHIEQMVQDRGEDGCSPTIFLLLKTIEEYRGDFLRLRLLRWALGNAALISTGTEEQKKKWSHLLLAMAITEPSCGSDTKAIETTAVLDGDEWVLNGEKIFVSNGIRGDGVVVWATLDRSVGRGAIKSFLIEKDTPGFIMAKKEKKMGNRTSDTAAFVMKDCRIPRDNLLGGDETIKVKNSGGFKGLMKTFNLTRPLVAGRGIGTTMACLDFVTEALKKENVEVDWEAGQHRRSAVQQKLIELEAELEAATLVTLRAGRLADQGVPNNLESSVSKTKGGDISRRGTQLALEILGACGITHDQLVEKWCRDARVTDIYEGTAEI
ncbi:MAG: acyl-CoA dehydrogenase, partial [Proteobacteria bacterium]|nr:acyl-CoA dehydrogenase [Pseudomonadota bacterium]